MRVLVFSDVHGNLPAFEKMLKTEPDIDLYISLGDVVNYGPWSNECVDLLESLNATKLKGNHEEYFLNGIYPGRSKLVQSFFQKCSESFERRAIISRYEPEWILGKFICRHTINDLYLFPDSDINTTGNYFIGHSHYQFDRLEKDYHVVNVGSVGQNRAEINVINYVIYEACAEQVELKSLTYDLDPFIEKMRELKYSPECINYYLSKPRRIG